MKPHTEAMAELCRTFSVQAVHNDLTAQEMLDCAAIIAVSAAFVAADKNIDDTHKILDRLEKTMREMLYMADIKYKQGEFPTKQSKG